MIKCIGCVWDFGECAAESECVCVCVCVCEYDVSSRLTLMQSVYSLGFLSVSKCKNATQFWLVLIKRNYTNFVKRCM